jgi:hypothetical protein
VKDIVNLLNDQVQFKRINKKIYFTDVGYGEKFITFSLPISNIDSFIDYSSLQITKELIRRFLDVRMPKGFRTRFFIFSEDIMNEFCDVYSSFNKSNILYNIDLKYSGSGYNIISFSKFSEEDIKKFLKTCETTGIDVTIKNSKKESSLDVKTLFFLIDENDFFTEKLDKSYYFPTLINKPINLIINFLSRVI